MTKKEIKNLLAFYRNDLLRIEEHLALWPKDEYLLQQKNYAESKIETYQTILDGFKRKD